MFRNRGSAAISWLSVLAVSLTMSATSPVALKAKAAEAPRDVPKAVSSQKAEVLRPSIPQRASVAEIHEAWDRYLANHKDCPPESLRLTVRYLGNSKLINKYDLIVALIRGSLRHQPSQPWMYEALALALWAEGGPKEEMERAIMSAAEFARNTTDLMFLALFLETLGLEERSLSLCRQIARLDPLLPEPYVQGLRLAQKLGDLEALQWASLAVLGQAWPEKRKEVWARASLAARDVLEKLKQADRTAEAARFETALQQALVRDCVVCVSWTGEGDVDFTVEEPTGSLCSLRCQQTAAGGVFLGDAPEQVNQEGRGVHRQIYVCPSGFSGDYRLLIRRVWGTLDENQVKVAVWARHKTGKPTSVSRPIVLENDAAAVQFRLTGGRRTDSLSDQQVARVAARYRAISQRVAALVDRQLREGATVIGPESNKSAIGYKPVIKVLPETEADLFSAVLSADRRYVRVTWLPLFGNISNVTTLDLEPREGKEP